METGKQGRRLNPRTIALIRKAMEAQTPTESKPTPTVEPAPEAPVTGAVARPALPPRPLALLPLQGLLSPVGATKSVAPKGPAVRAARGATGAGDVGVGGTAWLPGLGLNPASAPRPPAVRKPVQHGNFVQIAQPDAPLTDVVIVDTETTGAGPGARLVELGALHVRDGKVVSQFQTLVDPEASIPAYVIRVHGISNAMVKGAPTARPVLAAFLAFVGNRPLMAHNASFDRGILAQELQRVGLRRPELPMFCSLRLARKVFPQAPNHKLSTLATYLKIPDPPTHRALADCMTTVGVLSACADRHPLRTLHIVHGGALAL